MKREDKTTIITIDTAKTRMEMRMKMERLVHLTHRYVCILYIYAGVVKEDWYLYNYIDRVRTRE